MIHVTLVSQANSYICRYQTSQQENRKLILKHVVYFGTFDSTWWSY